MARWLHLSNGATVGEWWVIRSRIRWDASPSPAVMAGGIGGLSRDQYWIAEDDVPEADPDPSRPPYRIPLIAELAEPAPDAYTVASTFSGCGGSCLGYRMAGYRVLWANEFVPEAAETYRLNMPSTIIDERSILDVAGADVLAATGLAVGELDLLDGSPPCTRFSTAGRREKAWGEDRDYHGHQQKDEELFHAYARLLGELRPRTFVAENVLGLVRGVAKGMFLEVREALRAHGYRVAVRVLDAQWLGVPQMRQRVIFVGVRDDLGLDPVHPSPLPYRYSMADAVPGLSRLYWRSRGQYRDIDRGGHAPAMTLTAMDAQFEAHIDDDIATDPETGARIDFKGKAIEEAWERLQPGESDLRYFNLARPDPDRPSPTVTASGGTAPGTAAVTHPWRKRKFTLGELRRICGFPDDFILTGTYTDRWERLGNAVPPPMAAAIGVAIRDRILLPADGKAPAPPAELGGPAPSAA